MAAVFIIALVPDVSMNYPALAWTGVAVVGFATVLAVVLSRVHEWHRFALLVPVIDIFAIGAFRGGTGGVMSPFTALIVLPVVWLASGNGRRYILYSGVGTFLALLIPVSSPVREAVGLFCVRRTRDSSLHLQLRHSSPGHLLLHLLPTRSRRLHATGHGEHMASNGGLDSWQAQVAAALAASSARISAMAWWRFGLIFALWALPGLSVGSRIATTS